MKILSMKKKLNKVGEGMNLLLAWEGFSLRRASCCSEIYCLRCSGLEAVFIQVAEKGDEWFLVPMCDDHNEFSEDLKIKESVKLLPVSVLKDTY